MASPFYAPFVLRYCAPYHGVMAQVGSSSMFYKTLISLLSLIPGLTSGQVVTGTFESGSSTIEISVSGDGSTYYMTYGDVTLGSERHMAGDNSVCLPFSLVDIIIPSDLETAAEIECFGSKARISLENELSLADLQLDASVYKIEISRGEVGSINGRVFERLHPNSEFQLYYSSVSGLVRFTVNGVLFSRSEP